MAEMSRYIRIPPDLAREALLTQGACNAGGLVLLRGFLADARRLARS